jgi:hypothetical protein
VWPALYDAVMRVDFSRVQQLCSANATLVHEWLQPIRKGTALHVACTDIKDAKDAARMAAMLLDEFNANANATNKDGWTPSHWVADRGE